jgi:Uma2 family endonuclease
MAVQHSRGHEHATFEEYLEILAKDPEHAYEYLDGDIYMMTGGSPNHAIITINIASFMKNLLRGSGCVVYSSDVYVQLAEKHRVCPDVTVSCDPRDRVAEDAIAYPKLIVEVLSPATEARDRGKKALQYRACPSVQEYLLVSSEAQIVELVRREKNGFWLLQTLGAGDTLELTSIGGSLPVAEIYEDTSLVLEQE